ncbi:MAG TPA: TIGR03617 family F420-dependent LLM class oxidoreductase [Nocardioidaceae bacterium]|nr:TIGR03617 family F420-dependent LLM class oxidoreductase [Nocardioidaceae bacterium]
MSSELAIDIAFHGDPARLPAVAKEIEERGTVRGLFVAEAAHDPFVSLALASISTERLDLGTSIALAFARSPMDMAYSAYDVHRLSQGRLLLGLGSQIKPHIVRRYDMPWSSPSARMKEYVQALRAIWHTWQTGEKLNFRGEFYTHTLMPPLFNPGPLGFDAPEVWLAGVGPKMVEAAGAVADGFLCHPLLSRSYFTDVLVPQLAAGRASEGRADDTVAVCAMTMVATGRTEEGLAAAIAGTKRQIGFYSSTPAYKPVLDHHGWGELHEQAHTLTLTGRWTELGDLIDDEVLHTLAVVGELDQVGAGLRERFGGLADRVMLSMPYDADETLALDVASS